MTGESFATFLLDNGDSAICKALLLLLGTVVTIFGADFIHKLGEIRTRDLYLTYGGGPQK